MGNVLVTGGCGFIGSAVVNALLQSGHATHIVDDLSLGRDHWQGKMARPVLHVQDIRRLDQCDLLFREIRPVAVIHLAANHYIPFCEKNVHAAYDLNLTGTLNVLELCHRHSVQRMFFASTGDVYPPGFAPHREVDLVSPIYVYGHTKYLGEQICIKYFETVLRDSHLIIGRLFNAAGPRETNPHLLPDVVRQIVAGQRSIAVGNTWPKRDFVDVASMAEIIVALTLGAAGIEIVNIGSGQVQEVGEALRLLQSALPFEVDIVSVAEKQRPNDRPYLCPDTARLVRLMGRAAKPFDGATARAIFAEFELPGA